MNYRDFFCATGQHRMYRPSPAGEGWIPFGKRGASRDTSFSYCDNTILRAWSYTSVVILSSQAAPHMVSLGTWCRSCSRIFRTIHLYRRLNPYLHRSGTIRGPERQHEGGANRDSALLGEHLSSRGSRALAC